MEIAKNFRKSKLHQEKEVKVLQNLLKDDSFSKQGYKNNIKTYRRLLEQNCALWDFVVLTASNEAQAEIFRLQIEERKNNGLLPNGTKFVVLPDPDGKRVGSGGATLNLIKYIEEQEGGLQNKRILVIHSGGDSKRVPQYSVCGKIFSPVPRQLFDGSRSSLFDEFMIQFMPLASKIDEGMLVCSGDVLLMFDECEFDDNQAVAIAIQAPAIKGEQHGVYLVDEKSGTVKSFLHKKSLRQLGAVGAIHPNGRVDIDTGAILFRQNILKDLYSLVEREPEKFINDRLRLSLYGDLVYPLAELSTLQSFYKEPAEGDMCVELLTARTELFNLLHKHRMGVAESANGKFIHFGTTQELLELLSCNEEVFEEYGWSKNINSNISIVGGTTSNSYIEQDCIFGENCYVEDSYISKGSQVGQNCVLSNVHLDKNSVVPSNVAMHGTKTKDGKYVVRIYGVGDNPKNNKWFDKELDQPLWDAKIFQSASSLKQATNVALKLYQNKNSIDTSTGVAQKEGAIAGNSNYAFIFDWQNKIASKVVMCQIEQGIENNNPVDLLNVKLPKNFEIELLKVVKKLNAESLKDFDKLIKLYYYIAKILEKQFNQAVTKKFKAYHDKCFDTIQLAIKNGISKKYKYSPKIKIAKNEVCTKLPLRVNFAGGWTDTPPYCLCNGGSVINCAIKIDGQYPIEASIKKLSQPKIVLSSKDLGTYKEFRKIDDFYKYKDPNDPFAMHKAVLLACGIIPSKKSLSLSKLCKNYGGGFHFDTSVKNIPMGSGLGTSSILAAACVKSVLKFFGIKASTQNIYDLILYTEQLMSTGGGWQDQVGGMSVGINLITTKPGFHQKIERKKIKLPQNVAKELNERLAIVYTGQRRLARNLLREIEGNYLGNNAQALAALDQIGRLSKDAQSALEAGDLDAFAKILNKHWETSKKLDANCSNADIETIFDNIDDLIDGRMICGAGGGGYLQVLLKKGVTIGDLHQRLKDCYPSGKIDCRKVTCML